LNSRQQFAGVYRRMAFLGRAVLFCFLGVMSVLIKSTSMGRVLVKGTSILVRGGYEIGAVENPLLFAPPETIVSGGTESH
jgi:hypothetical protein